MDWSIVTERFACGGAPDVDGIRSLMRHGYTHVIDLRHTTTNTDLYWMNFAYLRNPALDDGSAKSIEWYAKSIFFSWGALLTPSSRIYVGCHSGIHRAPSTLYAILRTQGQTSREASSLVWSRRPDAELIYMEDAERAIKELGYP